MKYKILVRETEYIAYYVEASSKDEAMSIWAENGYDSDQKKTVDVESDILGCEVETAQ